MGAHVSQQDKQCCVGTCRILQVRTVHCSCTTDEAHLTKDLRGTYRMSMVPQHTRAVSESAITVGLQVCCSVQVSIHHSVTILLGCKIIVQLYSNNNYYSAS